MSSFQYTVIKKDIILRHQTMKIICHLLLRASKHTLGRIRTTDSISSEELSQVAFTFEFTLHILYHVKQFHKYFLHYTFYIVYHIITVSVHTKHSLSLLTALLLSLFTLHEIILEHYFSQNSHRMFRSHFLNILKHDICIVFA